MPTTTIRLGDLKERVVIAAEQAWQVCACLPKAVVAVDAIRSQPESGCR